MKQMILNGGGEEGTNEEKYGGFLPKDDARMTAEEKKNRGWRFVSCRSCCLFALEASLFAPWRQDKIRLYYIDGAQNAKDDACKMNVSKGHFSTGCGCFWRK